MLVKKKEQLSPFETIPSEVELAIRQSFRIKNFAPGEIIFLQDASPDTIYLVGNGKVKIVRVTRDGYESILCVRRMGDYFCPVPLLDGGTHLGTAIAMDEVTLFCIDKETFNDLCNSYPDFLNIVQGDCLGEVRNLMKRLEAYAFRSVRERVAFALLEESQRQQNPANQPLEIYLTQQDLAALVGASRESVSRALNKFARDGILSLKRGRVIVHDTERLEKICR